MQRRLVERGEDEGVDLAALVGGEGQIEVVEGPAAAGLGGLRDGDSGEVEPGVDDRDARGALDRGAVDGVARLREGAVELGRRGEDGDGVGRAVSGGAAGVGVRVGVGVGHRRRRRWRGRDLVEQADEQFRPDAGRVAGGEGDARGRGAVGGGGEQVGGGGRHRLFFRSRGRPRSLCFPPRKT